MPPPIYEINKLRKIRQKYSNLRAKVILQTGDTDNSEITAREGIDTMNEAVKGLLDDADWEYFGEVDWESSLEEDEDEKGAKMNEISP